MDLTLKYLLNHDTYYRAWFQKIPKLVVKGQAPPWRVYVQLKQGGGWARKDFAKYSEAYTWLRQRLGTYYDATISCKRQGFPPPALRRGRHVYYWPRPLGYAWCVYCRRPTRFAYYTKHHALAIPIQREDKRCSICGARQRMMPEFNTPLLWPIE